MAVFAMPPSPLDALDLARPDVSEDMILQRAPLTRHLYETPAAARGLRHFRRDLPLAAPPGLLAESLQLAVEAGILGASEGPLYRLSEAGEPYVRGRWLEEAAALALAAAGADHVRCGQRIFWRAGSDGSEHVNEVDVLATAAGRLILVSAKASAAFLLEQKGGEERLFEAMLELSYWNAHFAQGAGVPVLVTTSDFYDERSRSFRSPKLVERARVLGIFIVSADYGSFDRLTGRMTDILDDPDRLRPDRR